MSAVLDKEPSPPKGRGAMKKIAIVIEASRVPGRGVAQTRTEDRFSNVGRGLSHACEARAGVAPIETQARRSRSQLLAVLFFGASVALPPSLSAGTPSLKSPLDLNAIQSSAASNGQGTPAPRSPKNGDSEPGSNRPLAQPKPPQQSGGPQDRQVRPKRGADKPSGQDRRPGSKPPRPNPGPGRPPGNNHPPLPHPPVHHPQYGPGWPHYAWGGGNGWRLHQFYLGDMRRIDRWNRHSFYPGGYLRRIYLNRIQPIPPDLAMYLPPVPPGYEVGYFDGYCLLFDPFTLRIASVIDLYLY
jgi:hypothetical protein